MAQATAGQDPIAVGPEEAARLTGVCRSAIYRAQAAGDISGFKVGRRRLFLVNDLKAWMEKAAKDGKQ